MNSAITKHPITVFGAKEFPENQPIAATLEWNIDHITIEMAGHPAQSYAFSGLELSLGGYEKNQIILTPQNNAPLRIYLSPAAERQLMDVDHPETQKMLQRVRELRHHRFTGQWRYRTRFGLKIFALVLGTLLAYRLFLYSVASLMPFSLERKLSSWIAVGNENVMVNDKWLSQQIDQLGRQVAGKEALARYDFKFRIKPERVINAMAWPGGYIVVHTALIEAAESPEELAGVLGHEIEHVLQRHSLHSLADQYGFLVLLSGLTGSDHVSELAAKAAGLSFSRNQEKEADLKGLALLKRAGLSGEGMVRFFEKKHESNNADWLQYFSSHPADRNRAAYLRAALAKAPPASEKPNIEWGEFKRRCKTFHPPEKT